MPLSKQFPIYLCILLLTFGCSPSLSTKTSTPGKLLSADEIRLLISGSKVELLGYDDKAVLKFKANGKVHGENELNERNDGIWKIDSQESLCLKFKRWGHGNKICYSMYEQNDRYQLFRKGRKKYDLTIIEKGAGETITGKSRNSNQFISSTNTSNSKSTGSSKIDALLKPEPPEMISNQSKQDIGYTVREMARNCPGCNLRGANLAGADLSFANLQGANLAEANLRYANLRRANLSGANLFKANFTGANVSGIILEGANLQGVEGLYYSGN